MTREEIEFKSFENRFEYSYLAQPDGGSRSVIFSYKLHGAIDLIGRFEAQSLEKAFNYAMYLEGILKVSYQDRATMIGKINEFSSTNWNTITLPEYYTTASGIIKNLQDELDKEAQEVEKRRLEYLKWKSI